MKPKIRLGSVNYLNCRPLVQGLDGEMHSLFTLRFDPPTVCASLLQDGEIDIGMIPTIAYADRPGDSVVPGVSIASEGPVASVALFTTKPVSEIRTVALDTSSRSSVALIRILCARKFEIGPTFAPHAPDLASMLAEHDAALLIGDPALFVDPRAAGADKIDLGQAWTDMTGLPFVWAFWAGRAEAVSAAVVQQLQRAKEAGVRMSDAIADTYVAAMPQYRQVARHYLREHIQFELSDRMREGLRAYYREAAAVGVIGAVPDVRLFASDPMAR